MNKWTLCECDTPTCLGKLCKSSDSNLPMRSCWCAECKEARKEAKQIMQQGLRDAFNKITELADLKELTN